MSRKQPLTRDERATMAAATIEAMQKQYEADGEEAGDFADGERYLRDDATDEELRAEHAKWVK
jgi:hypothetical protein